MRKLCLSLWLASLFCATAARGLGALSANIPPGHSLYELLDSLDAYGCIRPTYRLIKPQSYADLRLAVFVPEGTACDAPEWLLLRTRVFESLTAPNRVRAQVLVERDDQVSLPGISAAVMPSFPFQAGRPLANGANLYAETDLAVAIGKDFGFAAGVTPGWAAGWTWNAGIRGRFFLQEGYLKIGYRRTEITWGRTQLEFGDARHGTLLLSRAGKPLDLIKLAVRPHSLGFGPFTVETFLAWQGDVVAVPGTKLWGIALGVRPSDAVELGILELYQFGGTGAPSLQLGDLPGMLFYSGADSLSAKRNRMLALHANLWLFRHALKFYWQVAFEKLGRPSEWLSRDLSWLLGLFLGRLGDLTLRLELARTAPRAYTHPFWTQGITNDGTTLGHPLGPDGLGAYVDIGIPNASGLELELSLFLERRGRSLAGASAPEERLGAGFTLAKRWDRYQLGVTGVYARANGHQFVPGATSDIGSVMATIQYTLF